MPVVVLGASGFIGRHAVEAFMHTSPQVRAYVRRPDAADDLRARGAKVAVGRIDDVDNLEVVMTGAHTVCHLAGGLNLARGETYQQAIVGSLQPVLQAAQTAGIRRILYLSYPGALPASPNPYLAAKGTAEQAIERSGLEHVIVRSTHVYGPGGEWLETMYGQSSRWPAVVIGSGRQVIAPVFVEDVAAVLAAADDRDRVASGVFGLQGPNAVTADGFGDLLAGRPRPKLHLRPSTVAAMSRLFRRPFTRPLFDVLAADSVADAPNAASAFGVALTPLTQGLARSLRERTRKGSE